MTESPRAVVVAHRLQPVGATGIHRYVVGLVTALLGQAGVRGLRVDVCSAREPAEPDWLPEGVRPIRPPLPRRPLHLAWTAVRQPRLDRLIGPFDIAHALSTAFVTPTNAPRVVTVHDLIPFHHRDWMEPAIAWACRRAILDATRHARRLIVPSAVVARDLCSTLDVEPERVVVIPEGVDDGFARPVDPATSAAVCARHGVEPGGFVIAVGAVSRRKNLPVVLDALAELRARTGAAPSLVAVGPSDIGTEETRAHAQDRSVGDLFRAPGFVSDRELQALLASAVALVHPSRDEGFGLTTVEAMAAGTPVLVSRSGSLPEVVGDAAVLLDPDDVDGWAAAIAHVLEDEAHRHDLVARGRLRAGEMTWERAADRTLAVYADVLRETGAMP